MKPKLYSLLLLALFGMTGMQAWADELTTTEIDGVTYYEIDDAADLVAFADLVNGGQFGANAVLTADITLTDVWDTPIGISGGAFTGIFDGQGHKITGFEAESATDGGGFFGFTNGATIKNFSFDGTLTSVGGTGSGIIGYPSSSTILNIHSTLTVTVPEANVHHVGGVVGSARGGNTISKCTFSGTMSVAPGSTDNFAGVVAYLGGDSVSFCANYGTIMFDDVNCAAGGVAGYLNNTGSYVQNCLNMGSLICTEPEATPKWGGAIVGRLRTHDTVKLTGNCWLEESATGAGKDNDGKVNLTQAVCFSEEQLATGEVCYLLNGDQSVIGWYQTIGTDAEPTLDATHAQVYMNGHKHCDGTLYEGATFTNDKVEVIQDDHNVVDGFCTYCGLYDENFLTPNADGFYEIANAKQLVWFEQLVNNGTLDANAILTADIDFDDLLPEDAEQGTEIDWTPIGNWGSTPNGNAGYKGHFDGQGHTIKNLNASSKQNYFGLFGVISTDCLIENFVIYGTYNTSYQYAGGVAAYARDDRPTIRNVHSFVNINNTCAGGRQGGILGGVLTTTYKTTIENCTYSGVLDGNDAGGNGNYGGIIGYVYNNGNTVADITNCLFDGEVVNNNDAPGGCTFGGFVGYSNSGVVTIKNCLSIGHVESAVYGQFFGAVKSSKSSLPNSYYKGEPLNGSASTVTLTATEVDDYQLYSGEIAWKLNEETIIDVVWRQTLGTDNYPKPYGDGAIVYQTPNGYECIDPNDPSSVSSFIGNVIANEEVFIEETVAYQPLLDQYKDVVASWESIDDFDEFMAAYNASAELKESIKESANKYLAYKKLCEEAAFTLEDNNLEGTWATFLSTYLDEQAQVEPGADYPNGSFAYIWDNRNLDNDALDEEIAFVNQMLANALAGGLTAGTEITRLLVNPDFATGDYSGWTEEHDGGGATVAGDTNVMPIPEAYNNKSFNAYQTLTEMPEGIYVMTVNSLFRAGSDVTSTFYAGQLYLNNTANYVMSPGEDVVSEGDAEPGVNCLGANGDEKYDMDGIVGYVPSSRNGCSVAFNAGRYLNYTATVVTDGNLTIGMRTQGTGLSKDWMPFGNLHVWYLGTAEEANKKLADVLEGYVKRAQVIVDFIWSEDLDVIDQYPNMSENLKDLLSLAIEAAEDADTGEKKMEVINTFSEIFNEVLPCRKAYIEMYKAANTTANFINILADYGIIESEEFYELDEEVQAAQAHYLDGDISTKEALAIIERLNEICNILPTVDGIYQLATADDVKRFSVIVNGQVDPAAKAILTADIDMSSIDVFESIGTTGSPFTGEFDGQGHKITGFGQFVEEEGEEGYYTLELSGDRQGFFGNVKNATIKNFSIDGAFTYDGGTGYGAIGWAEGSTLINIHSSLNIASVSTSHHIGGVCGSLRSGTKAYNCSFSGTITDSHGTHDCIGGIGGYSNENCRYENCANYGTIEFTASNAYASGICGYVNNDSFVGVFNCLNVGNVMMSDGTAPSYGGAIVGRLRSHANSKFENNYWLEGSATRAYGENTADATTVNAEQLKSGEICYKLNGDQSEINWFQTLGADEYPVLFDTHKIVYLAQDGTYTNDPSNTPDGSEENPFVVRSAADLCNLINLLVSGRMNYVVMEEDVDMAGVTDWTPLFNIPDQPNGYPYIDFDGKGHIISNLTSNTTGQYDYCGLFGVLCGNVRNLGVENADVTCTGGTGIIAGYLGHSTYGKPCYIEKVWVSGKVTANGYCGGMFGNVANEAHITNCYANVEVNGSGDLTGGIIGRVRAEVIMNNVYAAGSINLGGGIIGGGFQDATPAGTYNNIAVWNNTQKNFGPARSNENMSSIIYYDGTNFAEMQSQVVGWDPYVWFCDMNEGSYPILYDVATPDGIRNIQMAEQPASGSIYNLAGQRMSKMQKGINIVDGKKILVK